MENERGELVDRKCCPGIMLQLRRIALFRTPHHTQAVLTNLSLRPPQMRKCPREPSFHPPNRDTNLLQSRLPDASSRPRTTLPSRSASARSMRTAATPATTRSTPSAASSAPWARATTASTGSHRRTASSSRSGALPGKGLGFMEMELRYGKDTCSLLLGV